MKLFKEWAPPPEHLTTDSHQQRSTTPVLSGANPHLEAVIERGADDLVRQISAPVIEEFERYFRVGDRFCRVLYFADWPPTVNPNWLRDMFQLDREVDVSVHFQPLPKEESVRKLRAKISKEISDVEMAQKSGEIINDEQLKNIDDAEGLARRFARGEDKPVQVALQLLIRARSLYELDETTSSVTKSLSALGANTNVADLRQSDAWLSVMPFGRNYLSNMYAVRNMHTTAASYMFPLVNADFSHKNGLWYGINPTTNSTVVIDRFELKNPHAVVFGDTGSGKSVFSKTEMIRARMRGYSVITVDPDGETDRLAKNLGGQFITIAPNSPDRINALDFAPIADGEQDHLGPKIVSVQKLVGTMIGHESGSYGLNAEQVQIIGECLLDLYSEYGYKQDPRTQVPESQGGYCSSARMPILSDLLAKLNAYVHRYEHDGHITSLVRPVIAALMMYCGTGVYASLFDQRTTVELNSPFVSFNISGISHDEHLKRMGMYTVLEYIWTRVMTSKQARSGRRVMLYIDEAHVLMSTPETASFLDQLARRARKFGVAITTITQFPSDYMNCPEGQSLLDNSSMQVAMSLKPKQLEVLERALPLSESEVAHLTRLPPRMGMVIAGQDRALVSMETASRREMDMITTDPTEIAAMEAKALSTQHGELQTSPPHEDSELEHRLRLPSPGATSHQSSREHVKVSSITGAPISDASPTGHRGPPKPLGDRGRQSIGETNTSKHSDDHRARRNRRSHRD